MSLVLCLLMISCEDSNTFKFDGIRYRVLSDSTVEVVADDSYQNFNSISIPENILKDGIEYNVSCIGSFAFKDCKRLISIVIPTTVTKIQSGAFYGCNGMMSINIPNNVTMIDDLAFTYCSSLTSIKIPNNVRKLGDDAFAFCESLISVELPSNIRSIGKMTFTQCKSLMKVEIPDSVMSIGENAFSGCEKLRYIEIPSSVTNIDDYAFLFCSDLDVVIYNTAENIKIGKYSLQGCKSVNYKKKKIGISEKTNDIPDVVDINATPLVFNMLTNSTVEVIRDDSYWGLISIIIPAKVRAQGKVYSVTKIAQDAFFNTQNVTINIPSSVISLGDYAFSENGSLKNIKVDPKNPNFTSINGVLYNKKKTKIVAVPGGIKGTFVIPSGITNIGNNSFYGCREITSVKIPSSVVSIGDQSFQFCKALTNIDIPSSVTFIGWGAFWGCSEMSRIELPSSVTTIEKDAFLLCENLSVEIRNSSENIKIGEKAFDGCKSVNFIK